MKVPRQVRSTGRASGLLGEDRLPRMAPTRLPTGFLHALMGKVRSVSDSSPPIGPMEGSEDGSNRRKSDTPWDFQFVCAIV